MAASRAQRPAVIVIAIATALAGALVALVLGILTFGVQATVRPHGVPLAVVAQAEGPVATQVQALVSQVAESGGEEISWRTVSSSDEARRLLADKEVYGVLEVVADPRSLATTVVLSGTINPSGTQVAQQALTGVAQGVSAAFTQVLPGARVAPVEVITVAPTTAAGRVAPLAASALLWIGGMIAGAAFVLLAGRGDRSPGVGSRLLYATGTAVLTVAAVAGLLRWWDSGIPLGTDVLAFMLAVAIAFVFVQAALFRLLGIRAMAILGLLYLMAPAVAGQVPELLHPAYRAVLWSWTPFRFSTEGLRSLLTGNTGAPDVRTALWVFGALALIGLIVVVWPSRRRPDESSALAGAIPAGS